MGLQLADQAMMANAKARRRAAKKSAVRQAGIGIGRDALRDRSASVMTARSATVPQSAGLVDKLPARTPSRLDRGFATLVRDLDRDKKVQVNVDALKKAQAYLESEL